MPIAGSGVGKVTNDLELKQGKSKKYCKISIAVLSGYGENAHRDLVQAWAFDELAVMLTSSPIGKGSTIFFSGELSLSEYIRGKDKQSEKSLKLILHSWSLIAGSKEREVKDPQQEEEMPHFDEVTATSLNDMPNG